MEDRLRLTRLAPPGEPVRIVLDTDTYNEIDDQFAVAYALLSPEQLHVEAIHAAPFHNERSASPADGMERSYDEIQRVIECLQVPPRVPVLHGARQFMPDAATPVPSPAAEDLIARAMNPPDSAPLYIAAIGAITNVASAILLEPRIIDRIVIVWLGGQPMHWPDTRVFNVTQDPHAARVVLNSGVPLVHIPCYGVASHLLTTRAELRDHIAGRSRIGDYLWRTFYMYHPGSDPWAKEIWDISAIAWLINPDWVPTELVPAPVLSDDIKWSQPPNRHLIRNATFVYRNPIFKDLFQKIAHG
jgi:inosine-uridine nucleoside N-ribohydrolase